MSQLTVKECILNSAPKSCELDFIPSKLLIECLDSILPSLTDLFHSSFASGIFPQCFKSAFVTPILKKRCLDHNDLNNYRPVSNLCSLDTAGLHSILEPVGLDRGDGRRPDGVTSFPFKGGKALAWDATCTDSFSASNLYSTILNPGSASSAAEDLKRRKYPQLVADFEFVPVAVETSGIIGSAGCSLLTDIGRRISRATNDPRQVSYIFQQISVAIIRGNALAITASSRKYVQELVERH